MTLRETEWLLDNGLGVLALVLLPVVLFVVSWRKWRKDPLKLNQVDADWPLSEAHQRAFVFTLAAAVITAMSGMVMQLIDRRVFEALDEAVLNWRKIEFVDAPAFVKINALTGYSAERFGSFYAVAGIGGAMATAAVFLMYVLRQKKLRQRDAAATEVV